MGDKMVRGGNSREWVNVARGANVRVNNNRINNRMNNEREKRGRGGGQERRREESRERERAARERRIRESNSRNSREERVRGDGNEKEKSKTIVLTGNLRMKVTDSKSVEEEVVRRIEETMIEAGKWAGGMMPPGDVKVEEESRFDKVTKIVNGGGVIRAIIVKCRDKGVRDDVLRLRSRFKYDHGWWVNEQMSFEERERQRRMRTERRNRRFGLMHNMYERGGVWGYRN
jgi:hypothetical protein